MRGWGGKGGWGGGGGGGRGWRGGGGGGGGGVAMVQEGPGGHQSPTMSGVEGQKAAT